MWFKFNICQLAIYRINKLKYNDVQFLTKYKRNTFLYNGRKNKSSQVVYTQLSEVS